MTTGGHSPLCGQSLARNTCRLQLRRQLHAPFLNFPSVNGQSIRRWPKETPNESKSKVRWLVFVRVGHESLSGVSAKGVGQLTVRRGPAALQNVQMADQIGLARTGIAFRATRGNAVNGPECWASSCQPIRVSLFLGGPPPSFISPGGSTQSEEPVDMLIGRREHSPLDQQSPADINGYRSRQTRLRKVSGRGWDQVSIKGPIWRLASFRRPTRVGNTGTNRWDNLETRTRRHFVEKKVKRSRLIGRTTDGWPFVGTRGVHVFFRSSFLLYSPPGNSHSGRIFDNCYLFSHCKG